MPHLFGFRLSTEPKADRMMLCKCPKACRPP